jgi:ATP-dependent Clp protease ATP-binding subunit ClpC
VFERFTERARQAVVFAQVEARGLKHNYVGTEHLLLGLLREDEGMAARVLEALGVTIEQARTEIARLAGPSDRPTTGQIPFTPHAKKVLTLALREAVQMGDYHIGTEHLLLALVREDQGVAREDQGVASQALAHLGVGAEKVRNEMIRIFSAGQRSPDDVAAGEESPVEEAWVSLDPPASSQRLFGDARTFALVIGWSLFGVALAVGILIGRLIWG